MALEDSDGLEPETLIHDVIKDIEHPVNVIENIIEDVFHAPKGNGSSASGHAYGHIPDIPDPRDLKYDPSTEPTLAGPSGGLVQSHLPPIWNQQTIGSCTAHGVLRAFVHQLIRAGIALPPTPPYVTGHGYPAPFSRLQQYYNERLLEGTVSSDSGAQVRDAFRALAKYGVAPETVWPYNVSQFTVNPPQNAQTLALKNELLKYHSLTPTGSAGGPETVALSNGKAIVFGFNVPQYFEQPDSVAAWDPTQTTPLPVPPADYQNWIGGHCVVATYYNYSDSPVDTPFGITLPPHSLLIDNSWDVDWGIGGRFVMDAGWFASQFASSFWVVDTAK